jgi:hypothetical protein
VWRGRAPQTRRTELNTALPPACCRPALGEGGGSSRLGQVFPTYSGAGPPGAAPRNPLIYHHAPIQPYTSRCCGTPCSRNPEPNPPRGAHRSDRHPGARGERRPSVFVVGCVCHMWHPTFWQRPQACLLLRQPFGAFLLGSMQPSLSPHALLLRGAASATLIACRCAEGAPQAPPAGRTGLPGPAAAPRLTGRAASSSGWGACGAAPRPAPHAARAARTCERVLCVHCLTAPSRPRPVQA